MAFGLVVCLAALSGCGSGPASGQPGVLTFALSEDPDPLDHLVACHLARRGREVPRIAEPAAAPSGR